LSKIIKAIYFVKKGQPIGGTNIINRIVSKFIPPIVKTGDTFTISQNQIGYNPFPGDQKDLLLVIEDNGLAMKLLRCSERESGDKKIVVRIE